VRSLRVLVTGGAGLIGSHLVDELLAHGYEVSILDNLDPVVHPRGRPAWIPRDVRFVEGDVRDPAAVDRALEGCEGVFHQAVQGGFSPEGSAMADVNCTGTVRLLEAAARSGRVGRIVTASSMAIYGEGWYRCAAHGPFHAQARPLAAREARRWEMPCPACGADATPHPIPESSDPRPHGIYPASKYFQERTTLSFGQELGVHAVALRYFLAFGPRQSVHNAYSGICSIFSTQILNGLAPVVYEDGRQSRDIVFAGDVARANRIAFEDPRAAGRALNVASGTSTGIADFARGLARAYGRELEPSCPGRFRLMDTRHMLGDATALRALGWEPTVSMEEGVRRYAEWIRAQGDVRQYFTEVEARLRRLGIVREARA
jgi:dTDP-L-rhamnose 4-epimerase